MLGVEGVSLHVSSRPSHFSIEADSDSAVTDSASHENDDSDVNADDADDDLINQLVGLGCCGGRRGRAWGGCGGCGDSGDCGGVDAGFDDEEVDSGALIEEVEGDFGGGGRGRFVAAVGLAIKGRLTVGVVFGAGGGLNFTTFLAGRATGGAREAGIFGSFLGIFIFFLAFVAMCFGSGLKSLAIGSYSTSFRPPTIPPRRSGCLASMSEAVALECDFSEATSPLSDPASPDRHVH